MYFFLSVLTGGLVALMIQFNGVLQTAVGGSAALLSIHICGLSGALLLLITAYRRMKGDSSEKSPKIFLTAGMLGSLIVYLASVIFEKGGILFSLSGSLAGQTLAAAAAESFYKADRTRSPLIQRILSPALLIPGSVIIGLKAGAGPLWIILSWTPGIVLMIQQHMNSRNTARYGTPRTVVFNYISALIIIIPLFLFTSLKTGDTKPVGQSLSEIAALPWYIFAGGGLIGVFTTGMIAYLLLKSPALVVTLGVYAGELAGGLILDIWFGLGIAPVKLIGILLIIAGLGAGKIRPSQKITN